MYSKHILPHLISYRLRERNFRFVLPALFIIAIISILCGCGDSGSGSNTVDPRRADMERLSKQMSMSMIDCPQRIWPGYSWDDLQVVLVDRENKTAKLWNDLAAQNGYNAELSNVAYDLLPPEFKYASYGFGELNGYDTMSIATDADTLDPLALAFHEGFHMHGQLNWALPYGVGSREYNYPENYQPRYLRNQIGLSLLNKFTGEDQSGLEKGAYWYRKWLENYPEEATRFNRVDRIEGSAAYVDRVSTIIANTSCDISDDNLFTYLSGEIKLDNMYENTGFYPLGGEPYFLGEISGLLLKQLNKPGWENLVISGDTPLDILFDGVSSIDDTEDEQLLTSVRNYYNDMNEQLRNQLEPLIDSWNSMNFVRVSLPMSWRAGSFTSSGPFVIYQNNAEQLRFHHVLSGVFVSPTGIVIEISNMDMLLVEGSPCGFFSNSFPLSRDEYENITSDCINFDSDNIVGSECIGFEIIYGSGNETWICIE